MYLFPAQDFAFLLEEVNAVRKIILSASSG
jgi:hypothetical protein